MKEFTRMKRFLAVLCFLLLLTAVSAALGEASITFSPETPRAGDYVEVTVTPDRENPECVSYTLLYGEDQQKVFSGKGVQYYDTWFRPRNEGTYTLQVTVDYGKKDKETTEVFIPVSGTAPDQEGPDVVYSQKDGWWKKKKYASSELQTSGCAIFALSHVLQRIGFTGEDVTPEKLAKTYVYYREGEGTWNEGLVRYAAVDFDFTTQKELITSSKEIASCLRRGDYFSFSIVDGHIALADGISEDGTKVHIVDSAIGATYERIRNKEAIFVRREDGSFTLASVPEDHPGIRWFFETQEYGGMEYWMDIDYCALRGMRLIRVPWLKADPGDGSGAVSVSVDYVGTVLSRVVREKDAWLVPTRDLQITGTEAGQVQVAIVTAKKGTPLKDVSGKQIPNKARIKRNTMVLLLGGSVDNLLYAYWDSAFGYLDPNDIEVVPASDGAILTGVIAVNGSTSGTQTATVHLNPDAKSTGIAVWKAGTPVAMVQKKGDFYLLEGNGMRGWVHQKYILPDQEEEPEEMGETEGSQDNGQKINEGEQINLADDQGGPGSDEREGR